MPSDYQYLGLTWTRVPEKMMKHQAHGLKFFHTKQHDIFTNMRKSHVPDGIRTQIAGVEIKCSNHSAKELTP